MSDAQRNIELLHQWEESERTVARWQGAIRADLGYRLRGREVNDLTIGELRALYRAREAEQRRYNVWWRRALRWMRVTT